MADEPLRRPWWRKKRLIPLGVALVLFGYLLGYGPARWLVWTGGRPWAAAVVELLYRPVDMLVSHGPKAVADAILWYADFWFPDGRSGAT